MSDSIIYLTPWYQPNWAKEYPSPGDDIYVRTHITPADHLNIWWVKIAPIRGPEGRRFIVSGIDRFEWKTAKEAQDYADHILRRDHPNAVFLTDEQYERLKLLQ